ncbi:hypothetical protein LCGC14_0686680 [marine sediment metagenome]|uniref:Uncharacterized protein n=1 Tax=marine sediment metagenome TaxID=412755 RepID=A0A0F9T7X4_9ZZZZ
MPNKGTTLSRRNADGVEKRSPESKDFDRRITRLFDLCAANCDCEACPKSKACHSLYNTYADVAYRSHKDPSEQVFVTERCMSFLGVCL